MSNQQIFDESKKYMPGGVNSPVRAYRDMGIDPPVMKSGKGVIIKDEDGNEVLNGTDVAEASVVIDNNSNSPVVSLKLTDESAIAFGAPTELELQMSRFLCEEMDNVEMVRFVNSGTEATMSAIKLARGYTGKNKIIKFAGCYHGHFDGFLVEAGSGVLTEGIAGCLGIPNDSIKNTLVGVYNDMDQVRSLFEAYGDDIAAVIIEPVAGNMGVVKAENEFMETLRVLCDEYGSLLIFDEVMSGFRVAYKGAQSLFNVKPDLITYAKIIGGGLPCGVYGGRRDIMEKLSPLGGVYQAGTMSGNPVVMAAGISTLNILKENQDIYEHIEKSGEKLQKGIEDIAREKGIKLTVNRVGGMMTVFFTDRNPVRSYDDAKSCDLEMFKKYFLHMNKNGFNIPQSQFESMFLSAVHTEEHIDKFLETFKRFQP